MEEYKKVDTLITYLENDLLKDHENKELIVEVCKLYAEEYHKLRLILNGVTGSIGKSTKPVLTTLKRTDENNHICVCDLCKLSEKCRGDKNIYHKCMEDNTNDQYYL